MTPIEAAIEFMHLPPDVLAPQKLDVNGVMMSRHALTAVLKERIKVDNDFNDLQARLDAVYTQRNTAVIAFADLSTKLGWKAGWGRDNDDSNDYDEEWRTIVYVDLPTGQQLSWHMSPDVAPWAKMLPAYTGEWDRKYTGRDAPEWLTLLPSFAVDRVTDAMPAPDPFSDDMLRTAKAVTVTGTEYLKTLTPLIDAQTETGPKGPPPLPGGPSDSIELRALLWKLRDASSTDAFSGEDSIAVEIAEHIEQRYLRGRRDERDVNVAEIARMIETRYQHGRSDMRDEMRHILVDAARFEWVLPILCGPAATVEGVEEDERTIALGMALMQGLHGRDAIDAAKKQHDQGAQ